MITPEHDVPMFEYSISGPLPRTGEGVKADQKVAADMFIELNEKAQREKYAIRYIVWFAD